LQTQVHLVFQAGNLITLVPLPENTLKAMAWSFKRANLNAEDRDSGLEFTGFVL
jgi:hypothetical protein